jgi:hypothetical protein
LPSSAKNANLGRVDFTPSWKSRRESVLVGGADLTAQQLLLMIKDVITIKDTV